MRRERVANSPDRSVNGAQWTDNPAAVLSTFVKPQNSTALTCTLLLTNDMLTNSGWTRLQYFIILDASPPGEADHADRGGTGEAEIIVSSMANDDPDLGIVS